MAVKTPIDYTEDIYFRYMCSQDINISSEDLEAKQIAEQNQKFNEEMIGKIHLLLNGLSHRKSKYILELAIANLAEKAILHI